MLQPWVNSVITEVRDETANTKRFFLEIPECESFDFTPGQFVTLDLPIHEQKNKRWRSYSIASRPDGTNRIELIIVLLEGGLGTAWLWEHGKPGAEIPLRGPQGKFVLPETIDRDIYLICTGTGIAPFRSMAQHLHKHNIPHRDIFLIFGCRYLSDSLYRDELTQLQADMPGFHYLPTYSREAKEAAPGIRTGYVHKVYEELIAERRSGDQLPDGHFFLCGWKNMIDEARQRLQALGYDKKAIHFELYG